MENNLSSAAAEILMVEDSLVEAELLRRILVKAGYRVRQAKNGEEGLHSLHEIPCALVVSDIQMPLMDGYELCHAIKQDEKLWNTPVILMSVLSEPEDIIKALNAGADSYLTKPYVEASLLARISSLLSTATSTSRPEVQRAEAVEYNGKHYVINADSRQLLNLLLSIYENTLTQNRELASTQAKLNQLNDDLESRVQERTAALQESETRYRRITEGLTDYQYTVRIENGHAVETVQSPACVTVTGYTAQEFAENPYLWIQMIVPEDREPVREHVSRIMAGEDVPPIEHHITRKDGETRWVSDTTILFKDSSGKLLSYDGVIKDITERKQAHEKLLRGEASLNEAQYIAQVGSWTLDMTSNVLNWSNEIYRIFEIDPTAFGASYDAFLNAIHPDDRALVDQAYTDAVKNHTTYNIVHRLLMSDGRVKYVHEICNTTYDASGKPLRSSGTVQDITDRKQTEIALAHAYRALATLGAVNRQLVHATDENELLQAICQAIVEQRGYRMAWVGYAQQDEQKTIKIMAYAGHDDGYLQAAHLSWAENKYGMGPSGRAIRSSSTQLCQDIANDPHYKPWRDAALQRGYVASIALPLVNGLGQVFGILTVYAEEVNAFIPAEVDLLEEMAGDLAFGVRTLHTSHERDLALEQSHKYLAQLKESLEDTVKAISSIVEMRDPYTAGHQSRVAELATAIAREIGLSDEQVQAIHLASIVHDLGKINIPAEILSRPGRLSELEYSLIKTHAQAGYDILKDINFPWPVAQMVLQHHERLDGSGYPYRLKADAIALEARILSVADVVEAMSSHRPYRAALGTESAMEEITKYRDTAFDIQVVDACLRLFREKRFSFKA